MKTLIIFDNFWGTRKYMRSITRFDDCQRVGKCFLWCFWLFWGWGFFVCVWAWFFLLLFCFVGFFPLTCKDRRRRTWCSSEGWQIKPGDLMVAQDKELSAPDILQYLSLLDYFLMWCIRQAGLDFNGTYAFSLPYSCSSHQCCRGGKRKMIP